MPKLLEYAFLGNDKILPVITEVGLELDKKESLLRVLKTHKRVIRWKIFDIRMINPSFCTHKILIEDEVKARVQP